MPRPHSPPHSSGHSSGPQTVREPSVVEPPAVDDAPPPIEASEPQASGIELEQVVDAWQRTIVEAVRERSIPVASLLAEARPTELEGDTLTLAFPAEADFHRRQVAEPGNIGVLRDALYEVTGRKLAVVLETGDPDTSEERDEAPLSEDAVISLLKETLDAEEVTDE